MKDDFYELHALASVLSHLNLNEQLTGMISEHVRGHCAFITQSAKAAYSGHIPHYPICKQKPFTRLAVVCYKLVELKRKYAEKNIPEQVFINTIQDVQLRQSLYYSKTGKHGLSKGDVIWFRHLFNMRIFKLNTIQFQLFHMVYLDRETIGRDYMVFPKKQKEKLPPGTPVINIHIQKGADLSPFHIDRSLELARDFFNCYYPEHKEEAYICYSWLLYSGNQRLLTRNSNILSFANRFEIIAEIQHSEEGLQNIFGKRYRAKSDYPQQTTLQKNALKHLSCLGYACGILFPKNAVTKNPEA